MKIFIPDMDGCIGGSLTLCQLSLGNTVCEIDNFSRRNNVEKMKSYSVIPMLSMRKRINLLEKNTAIKLVFLKEIF